MKALVSILERKKQLGAIAVGLVALLVAGAALATIPSGGAINGCYAKKGGSLRVIDSASARCKSGEKALAWNQAGTPGPKGDIGAQGPAGAKGDAGSTGPQGSPGATGAQGSKGDSGATGPAGSAGPKGDTGPAGSSELLSEVRGAQTDLPANGSKVVVASCPFPKHALGGGFSVTEEVNVMLNIPAPNLSGWEIQVHNTDWINSHSVGVYAICA